MDVRDMTLASLRRQIGVVQQDVFLFAGIIRDNIAYGEPGASDAEVLEAARRACEGRLPGGRPAPLRLRRTPRVGAAPAPAPP